MKNKCEFCDSEIQDQWSGQAVVSNWVLMKGRLLLSCDECYSANKKGFEMAVKIKEENQKEVGLMSLLIACLIIWGFGFPWWMYLITMVVWVGTRIIKAGL